MKINKVLLVSLSTVGALTIAGSGFSAWYFGHQDLKIDNKASLFVTSDVAKGEISIVKHPSLVVFSEGQGRKEDLTDGIEFYTLNEDAYTKDDKVVLKYIIEDENDSIEGNDFKLFINIEEDSTKAIGDVKFSSIVSITSAYSLASSTGYDFSKDLKKYEKTETDNAYFLYTLKLNDAIQYSSSDSKPLTQEKYENLCKALTNAKISVKFEVK